MSKLGRGTPARAQQGRMQLDADWNELVDSVSRRWRAERVPDDFKVAIDSSGKLTIAPGRISVDGILAENHGADPSLPAVPAGGPHLVYLDVFEREMTAVWAVRILQNTSGMTCASDWSAYRPWTSLAAPSAGRLTSGGRYRGVEDRLYRVEIHDDGTQREPATFKWSRDNGPGCVVPVTAATAPFELEDGVVVQLGLDAGGGQYRVGDHWTFAARTAGASVETLVAAAPAGVRHHYRRLAVINEGQTPEDCRVVWPGGDCDGTVNVHPGTDLQAAIDAVKTVGGKVSFEPGVYVLKQPLQLDAAYSLTLQGHGPDTVLVHTGAGPAIDVTGSVGVTLEQLTILAAGTGSGAGIGVLLRTAMHTTIRRCAIVQGLAGLGALGQLIGSVGGLTGAAGTAAPSGICVALDGAVADTKVHDCLLIGGVGLASLYHLELAEKNVPIGEMATGGGRQPTEGPSQIAVAGARQYLVAVELAVHDNFFACAEAGVYLGALGTGGRTQVDAIAAGLGIGIGVGSIDVSRNSIYGCQQVGIGLFLLTPGIADFPSRTDICDNMLAIWGCGIGVGCDTRIDRNDISALSGGLGGSPSAGIALLDGLGRATFSHCGVDGNRISGMSGAGIEIWGRLISAGISGNTIWGTRREGIVMRSQAALDVIAVDHNRLVDVAADASSQELELAGIAITSARIARIAHNQLIGVAPLAREARMVAGIFAVGMDDLQIRGNQVLGVGPETDFAGAALGIQVLAAGSAQVADNSVQPSPAATYGSSSWLPLRMSHTTIPMANVPRKPVMNVHGNSLETTASVSPSCDISSEVHNVLFSNNHCRAPDVDGPPVVRIALSGAATINANYVEGGSTRDAVQVLAPGGVTVPVLGNVTVGIVTVRGDPLPAPWDQLNVIG